MSDENWNTAEDEGAVLEIRELTFKLTAFDVLTGDMKELEWIVHAIADALAGWTPPLSSFVMLNPIGSLVSILRHNFDIESKEVENIEAGGASEPIDGTSTGTENDAVISDHAIYGILRIINAVTAGGTAYTTLFVNADGLNVVVRYIQNPSYLIVQQVMNIIGMVAADFAQSRSSPYAEMILHNDGAKLLVHAYRTRVLPFLPYISSPSHSPSPSSSPSSSSSFSPSLSAQQQPEAPPSVDTLSSFASAIFWAASCLAYVVSNPAGFRLASVAPLADLVLLLVTEGVPEEEFDLSGLFKLIARLTESEFLAMKLVKCDAFLPFLLEKGFKSGYFLMQDAEIAVKHLCAHSEKATQALLDAGVVQSLVNLFESTEQPDERMSVIRLFGKLAACPPSQARAFFASPHVHSVIEQGLNWNNNPSESGKDIDPAESKSFISVGNDLASYLVLGEATQLPSSAAVVVAIAMTRSENGLRGVVTSALMQSMVDMLVRKRLDIRDAEQVFGALTLWVNTLVNKTTSNGDSSNSGSSGTSAEEASEDGKRDNTDSDGQQQPDVDGFSGHADQPVEVMVFREVQWSRLYSMLDSRKSERSYYLSLFTALEKARKTLDMKYGKYDVDVE